MNKLSMKKKLNSKSQSFKPVPENINNVNELTQKEIDYNKAFKNDFPRLQFYNSIEQIKQKFDSMKFLNQNFEIKYPEKAFFFNILTNSLEDMHKAIKYGIWTSSRKVNESLIELYNQKEKDQQIRIFLFFRIKNQTTCCGVSELISNYIHEQQFNYWLEKIQWKGLFNLRWVYIGNIGLQTIPNGDKILSSFQINQKEGFELLQYYQQQQYSYQNSVFVFFSQLDLMEDKMITQRAKFSSVIQYFNHDLFFFFCQLVNLQMSKSQLILHTFEGQIQSQAIIALADYQELDLQLRILKPINLKDKLFKKGSHTFPQLQYDKKSTLEKTGAIMRYLSQQNSDCQLYSKDQEQIDVIFDLLWELNTPLAVYTLENYGLIKSLDKNIKKNAQKDFNEMLKGLDTLLMKEICYIKQNF